jgi:hypothetical protein
MLMRRTTLSLIVLGFALFAPACEVSAYGPDTPLVCVGDGSACAPDADCCSGACSGDGFCGVPSRVIPVACLTDDAPCSNDAECCSYLCAPDGACGLPASGCHVDNEACNTDADCCSGLCAADGFCGIPS